MDHPRIMVVIGEYDWTLQALHQACATASNDGHQVVLLKMVPVRHHLLLGVSAGGYISRQEHLNMAEYASVVEGYDIPCSVCVFQYAAYSNALVSAAEQLDVHAIFAPFPQEWVDAWRRLKIWWLKRTLLRRDRALHVIEQAVQA